MPVASLARSVCRRAVVESGFSRTVVESGFRRTVREQYCEQRADQCNVPRHCTTPERTGTGTGRGPPQGSSAGWSRRATV